jgi:hypothetical protein
VLFTVSGGPRAVLAVFRDFLQPLQANVGIVSRLDQKRFLKNPFLFIIHQPSYHLTPYNVLLKFRKINHKINTNAEKRKKIKVKRRENTRSTGILMSGKFAFLNYLKSERNKYPIYEELALKFNLSKAAYLL